jgi:hypothetical protein
LKAFSILKVSRKTAEDGAQRNECRNKLWQSLDAPRCLALFAAAESMYKARVETMMIEADIALL